MLPTDPVRIAIALITDLRHDACASLSVESNPASRLFETAWEAYRPNIPDYEWSSVLAVSPDELEAVHWLLFFTSFMAAWWYQQGEGERRESIRTRGITVLDQVGLDEDCFIDQLDLLEDIFVVYLKELRVPRGSLEWFCKMFDH